MGSRGICIEALEMDTCFRTVASSSLSCSQAFACFRPRRTIYLLLSSSTSVNLGVMRLVRSVPKIQGPGTVTSGCCSYKRLRSKGPRAGLEELLHNQVFVSASIAGLSSQILKPLLSVGSSKCLNWNLIWTSGGMPSSHSATMVAVATTIGLERGLADSTFGLAALVAIIVMYDAQGVRQAVGEQARIINWILLNQSSLQTPPKPECLLSVNSTVPMADKELVYPGRDAKLTSSEIKQVAPSVTQAESDINVNGNHGSVSVISRDTKNAKNREISGCSELNSLPEMERKAHTHLETPYSWTPKLLNESVGHTRLEVGAGALYGFIIALAAHTIFQ